MREILDQGSFVCHKKTDKQCAGHMLLKGDKNQFVNMARRLGCDLELSGRELVFDTEQKCVDHHDAYLGGANG